MKTAILIANGVKQIMLTPENDTEREALSYISPDDDIHTVIKKGDFYGKGEDEIFGVDVYKCQGGWMRAENNRDSIMFVLTPKKKDKKINNV